MIAPVHSGKNVIADVSEVTMGLDRLMDLMAGRQKDVLRYGASIMKQETARSFSAGVDPEDNSPWPAREHSYPWPILNHFGNLKRLLEFGWGVTKRDNKPRVFGKVKDVVYMQRSFRGGRLDAGFTYGTAGQQHKSAFEVAASIFFGRSGTRTTEGVRHRRMGRGRYERSEKWSYGGGRGYGSSETGPTPPRPFFGFGKSAKRRIKDYAEKRLERAFDKAS